MTTQARLDAEYTEFLNSFACGIDLLCNLCYNCAKFKRRETMKKSKSDIGLNALFGIYIILLVWIIIFRLSFSIAGIHKVRELNFIPFYYKNVYECDIPIVEAILNVLIFAPLGIYLKMFGISNKKILLSGFFISFMFELLQYIFRLGASDITDIITNTLGTMCGMYLYLLSEKILKNKAKTNKIFKTAATAVSIIMMAFFLFSLINAFI